MPRNDKSRGSALAVAVLAMTTHVSAAPTRRDGPALTAQTIQTFTSDALAMFLASKNADQNAFNVKGPWSTIDFAGATGALLSEGEINKDIFDSCDTQKDRATNQTSSFSLGYTNFIQDLAKAMPPPVASQQVNDTTSKVQSTCYTDTLPKARNEALTTYNNISSVPTTNASDPNFLSWASTAFPDYQNAYTACQQAIVSYDAAVDSNQGNDAGVFTAARDHVEPLVNGAATAAPGINMPIQAAGTTGPQEGSFVAFYDIPTLNSTLTAWQAGAGLSQFTFSSSQFNDSTSSSTKFGGAHLGITYEGISASANAQHSQAQSSANVSALGFNLTFQGLALLGIEQGIWFDNYLVARASEKPDSNHTAAKGIFSNETYFGSSNAPGPLSVYNAQALVGFKPSWSIQLVDSHTSSSSSSTEAGVDISILGLLDIGGYGGSTSNNTHYDNSTNTLTIADDSNNAYIIGYVQDGYFTTS